MRRATVKSRETAAMRRADEARRRMAGYILERMDRAGRVEDLIRQEMVLQKMDLLAAQSEQDRKSIDCARLDYRQIDASIRQMRRNPDEYFRGNMAMREIGGDFRRFPRSRGLRQLAANRARFRDRAAFLPGSESVIWYARVRLADKTEVMLRKLHRELAESFERKLETAKGLGQGRELGLARER
jgi:hypothetical protein